MTLTLHKKADAGSGLWQLNTRRTPRGQWQNATIATPKKTAKKPRKQREYVVYWRPYKRLADETLHKRFPNGVRIEFTGNVFNLKEPGVHLTTLEKGHLFVYARKAGNYLECVYPVKIDGKEKFGLVRFRNNGKLTIFPEDE